MGIFSRKAANTHSNPEELESRLQKVSQLFVRDTLQEVREHIKSAVFFAAAVPIAIAVAHGAYEKIVLESKHLNLPIHNNYRTLVQSITLDDINNQENWMVAGLASLAFSSIGLFAAREAAKNRRATKNFELMFNGSPDGMLKITTDGIILDANRTTCERLGYHKEEILGKPIKYINASNLQKYIPSRLETVMREGKGVFRTVHVGRDGTICPVETRSTLITDQDGNKVIFNVVRDIREQQRLEDELESSKKELETLIEGVHDIFWKLDEKGRYTYLSPQVRRIIGYTPDELIGKTPIDILHPDYRDDAKRLFHESIANPREVLGFENYVLHKNGKDIVILEGNSTPLFDKNGLYLGSQGVNRDITRHREMERENKRAQEKAREAERRADRAFAIAQLGHSVAHDINNATGSISGATELLNMTIEDHVGAQVDDRIYGNLRKYLSILEGGVDRLRDIGATFSVFHQASETKELVLPNSTIRRVLTAPTITDQVEYHLEELAHGVNMSEQHMSLLIKKMGTVLTNYLKMPNTQGVLLASTKEDTVYNTEDDTAGTQASKTQQAIIIEITHKGRHYEIDPDNAFNDLYLSKLPGSASRNRDLLAIDNLAKKYGGNARMTIEGDRVSITVQLPLSNSTGYTTVSKSMNGALLRGDERVLLVDDDDALREIMRMNLEKNGYQVTTASDGLEGFGLFKDAIARKEPFDCVVTDIMMRTPGDAMYKMMCDYLDSQGKRRGPTAIAISGHPGNIDNQDRVRSMQEMGIDKYLPKPFSNTALVTAVRHAIDTHNHQV